MTRLFIIFLLTFAVSETGFAQSDMMAKKDSLRAVVIKLFDALAELDTAKAKSFCTSDITILESGKVWNFDSLALRISTRKAKSPDFKRVNHFDFIEIQVLERLGYISYFNHATISYNGRTTNVKWIETAVLKQEVDGWKISLLHSTELERKP
jgi:ketosteroid isomerase-like protein